MMRAWRMTGLMSMMVVALMLWGCGGGDNAAPDADSGANGNGGTAAEQQGGDAGGDSLTIPEAMQAFEDDGNVAEITIEGDDRMQYSIDAFSVEAGQMVRLTLEHVGQLPAQAMGHNVVIIQPGEDVFDFAADANEQDAGMDNDYVPDPVRDRVIAFTEIIGGGETTVVEFKAPENPGEYPFLCSFPGHVGSMNGIMTVE